MNFSDQEKIEPGKVRDYIDTLEEMASSLESRPLEKIKEAMSLLLDRIEELEEIIEYNESDISEKNDEIEDLNYKINRLEQELEELQEAKEREVDISDFNPVTLDKISAAVERRDKTLEFDGPWVSDEKNWHRGNNSAEVVIFLPGDKYLCHRRLRRASRED